MMPLRSSKVEGMSATNSILLRTIPTTVLLMSCMNTEGEVEVNLEKDMLGSESNDPTYDDNIYEESKQKSQPII